MRDLWAALDTHQPAGAVLAPAVFLSRAFQILQPAIDALVEDYVAANDDPIDLSEIKWLEATPNGTLPLVSKLQHRETTLLELSLSNETVSIVVSWTRDRH